MDRRGFTTAVCAVPSLRSILVIDPDEHTPGAAFAQTHEDAPCFVWGGNKTGAPLACPSAAQSILATLSPDLVVVEAALSSGGKWASKMHDHNLVRGGWVWLCGLAGVPVVLASPESWQASAWLGPRHPKGRKARYRAYAHKRSGKSRRNEDADAALCVMDYAFHALGLDPPREIRYGRPPLTIAGVSC